MRSMVDNTCIERLEAVATTPFKRLSYTEAVNILTEVVASGKKKFEYEVGRYAAIAVRLTGRWSGHCWQCTVPFAFAHAHVIGCDGMQQGMPSTSCW
jgi:hypothetical protein